MSGFFGGGGGGAVASVAGLTGAITASTLRTALGIGPLDGLTGLSGAWSMSRALLTAYGGALYTDAGSGAISSWLGQVSSRNFTNGNATQRPTAVIAGSNSRLAADFDGLTDGDGDSLSYTSLGDLITASDGYIIMSLIADALSLNSGTVSANHRLFSEQGLYAGIALRSGGIAGVFSENGGLGQVFSADTFNVGDAFVLEFRHTGGVLGVRVNGGTWATVAAGNTGSLGPALLGIRTDANATNCKLFELATFSTVPSVGTQDALVTSFKAWVGVA